MYDVTEARKSFDAYSGMRSFLITISMFVSMCVFSLYTCAFVI